VCSPSTFHQPSFLEGALSVRSSSNFSSTSSLFSLRERQMDPINTSSVTPTASNEMKRAICQWDLVPFTNRTHLPVNMVYCTGKQQKADSHLAELQLQLNAANERVAATEKKLNEANDRVAATEKKLNEVNDDTIARFQRELDTLRSNKSANNFVGDVEQILPPAPSQNTPAPFTSTSSLATQSSMPKAPTNFPQDENPSQPFLQAQRPTAPITHKLTRPQQPHPQLVSPTTDTRMPPPPTPLHRIQKAPVLSTPRTASNSHVDASCLPETAFVKNVYTRVPSYARVLEIPVTPVFESADSRSISSHPGAIHFAKHGQPPPTSQSGKPMAPFTDYQLAPETRMIDTHPSLHVDRMATTQDSQQQSRSPTYSPPYEPLPKMDDVDELPQYYV